MRKANKNSRKVDPRTLQAAGFLLLLTSLSADAQPMERVATLYRDRWQVEIGFKRLKTLGRLDELPSADPVLARTWLLAHLIAAVLTDDLANEIVGFLPSVPGTETRSATTLACLGEGKGRSCSTPFSPDLDCIHAPHSCGFAESSQKHQDAERSRHASSDHRKFARMGQSPWPCFLLTHLRHPGDHDPQPRQPFPSRIH